MNKHLLFLYMAVIAASGVFAQGDGKSPGSDYYIHGIFNPVIADVRKIDIEPVRYDTILPTTPITYRMLPVRGEVPARVDSIEAAKLNIQLSQQRLYKGYVKAGFGLYTTPLFELYYDQTRSRKNAYGIHVKHMSSNGGLDDVGPSDYSFNTVDAYYNAYLKHHEVGGRLIYDRRRISYYGYASTDSLENLLTIQGTDEDARKQVYNDIGFAAHIKSLFNDSAKVAHDIGLEVHNYKNLTGSTETNLTLTAKLHMQQGSETYGGELLVDNNAYRAVLGEGVEDVRTNGTLLGVSPYVSTHGDKYTVRVGAGLFLDSQGKTTFHFFPQAYLDYHLFDEILVPYVGVDGRRSRNGFRSLTRMNSFLGGAPELLNSSLMYDIYGGLRGSFSSDIGFDIRISKSRMKNRPLFANQATLIDSVTLGDRFSVIYDDIDQLDISGQITYSHGEHAEVYGRIDVFTYDQENSAEPWNLPPYQLTLGANYDFQDKLLLKVEALLQGSRKGVTRLLSSGTESTAIVDTATDLKGYLDLHLGLEYRYTKRLSVFLDVSNLSASKYERWYNYPVQRTLFLGGATYAF